MVCRGFSATGLVALILLVGATSTATAGLQDFTRELLENDEASETGEQSANQPQSNLSQSQVALGLREALRSGATHAVEQLGQQNGFWGDPELEIPLPPVIDKASVALQAAGYGPQLDTFHRAMNRAAEDATAEVGSIFQNVISKMTVADAYEILRGSEGAATEYLRDNSSDALRARIRPIVADATANTGVTQSYKSLTSQAGPLLSAVAGDQGDLDNFVTQAAMDSLFSVIARQEARIRANPAARTTDLLREVFSQR